MNSATFEASIVNPKRSIGRTVSIEKRGRKIELSNERQCIAIPEIQGLDVLHTLAARIATLDTLIPRN